MPKDETCLVIDYMKWKEIFAWFVSGLLTLPLNRKEQETQMSLPNRATRLCNVQCMAEKHASPEHCTTMPTLVVLGQTMQAISKGYQNWEALGPSPLGLGRGWALTNTYAPPFVVTHAILIDVGQVVLAYVWSPPEKLCTSRHTFQGHSRSSELYRIDWILGSYDFLLLMFH